MDIRQILEAPAFVTKDGSEIRELLSYRNSCIANQSLAEARVMPGQSTARHYHRLTEEIYYILSGRGLITVAHEQRTVVAGDAIAIRPGVIHAIANVGQEVLTLLCCCAPPYEHEDTVLV